MCDRGNRYDFGPRSDKIRHAKHYDAELYERWKKRQNGKAGGGLDIPSIFYSAKDAIVTIYCSTNTTDDTVVEQVGSGFFIDKLTVVTAAHVVMYNNAAVDRSPPVIAVANPQVTPTVVAPGFARVGTIKVRVNNVNGSGNAFFYTAKLVGMSPSFDLAVLQIQQLSTRVCTVPLIEKHPVLEWGCSRGCVIGERVLIVGDSRNFDAIGLSHGIISDNLYSDTLLDGTPPDFTEPAGYWGFEAVVTDAQAAYFNSGGPLLDDQGRVLGVISGIDTSAYSVSPLPDPPETAYIYKTVCVAEHVAKRIVKALANGMCDEALRGHVEEIQDPLGNFYRYNYGYLGVTGFYAFGPDFLRLVPNSGYQKQKGFVITGVDPDGPLNSIFPAANIYPYPATAVPPDPVTATSELFLVTELNGTPVGVGPGQIPFSSITFLEIQNMVVVVTYRRGSEGFKCPYQANVYLGYLPLTEDLPPNAANQTSAMIKSIPSSDDSQNDLDRNHPLTRGINLKAFDIQKLLSLLTDGRVKQALITLLGGAEKVVDEAAIVAKHLPAILEKFADLATKLGLDSAAALAQDLAGNADALANGLGVVADSNTLDSIADSLRSGPSSTSSTPQVNEPSSTPQVSPSSTPQVSEKQPSVTARRSPNVVYSPAKVATPSSTPKVATPAQTTPKVATPAQLPADVPLTTPITSPALVAPITSTPTRPVTPIGTPILFQIPTPKDEVVATSVLPAE